MLDHWREQRVVFFRQASLGPHKTESGAACRLLIYHTAERSSHSSTKVPGCLLSPAPEIKS